MKKTSDQKSQVQSYNILVDFAKFLRQNGDKLFDKDVKLCLRNDHLLVLQDYLGQLNSRQNDTDSASLKKSVINSKEFLELYKTNQLHLIQDFLFKITNLKIISETPSNTNKLKLSIFGSLTYLEIKNIPIKSIADLKNLRNQLEVLICVKSISKLQDLLHLCGADQSMPLSWPKLHTLNLSYNELCSLDNSLRLSNSIEILDLSHNNLKECGNFLDNLCKLKKVNLSFNKLQEVPSIPMGSGNTIEYLDISYNSIEKLDCEHLKQFIQLKHLNLNSNLINELVEINHLKLLKRVITITLEKNPVKNNPLSDYVIDEIITNNKIFSTFKAPVINQEKVVHKERNQNEIKTSSLNNLHSTLNSKPSKLEVTSKRKLKANNIFIEHDDNDYLIISTSTNMLDPSKASMTNKFSTSFEYESTTLQNEIEKMKQMRQNYGTNWLLSTPNLISNSKPTFSLPDYNKTETSHLEDKILKKFDSSIENVIDLFVYKLVFDKQNANNDEDALKSCVMLSLSDKYLVEKDETNTILRLDEIVSLNDIDFSISKKEVKLTNKKGETLKYNFENSDDLKTLIDYLHKALFNPINFYKSDVYFCIWCVKFNKKSKFNIEEPTDLSYDNLTCTVCNQYLIKDKVIQSIKETEVSKALIEVNEKHLLIDEVKDLKEIEGDVLSKTPKEIISINTIEYEKTELPVVSQLTNAQNEKVDDILSNNTISKTRLDQTMNDCKRINNNLKLYLMINTDKIDSTNDDEDQAPICNFKLKHLFYYSKSLNETKLECLENSLCILMNNNITIFKILNLELFNENTEFDKCLKKELNIKLEQIEEIEIGLANNYIYIQSNDARVQSLKLFTQDIYQTYVLRNILLKIMNDSNYFSTLNHSKKISQLTRKNLQRLLKNELVSKDLEFSFVNLSYIEDLKINDEVKTSSIYKYSCYEIVIYSDELMIILDENLSYLDENDNDSHFKLIDAAKVSDIVQLKLSKEDQTKLEINFVDESKNSKQFLWTMNFNNQPHMLSQLISQLKDLWEGVYSIDLPINY